MRWGLGTAALFFLVVPSMASGAARAPSSVTYTGMNAQGLALSFVVVGTRNGPLIQEFDLSYKLVCEETGDVIFLEASFAGFDVPIKDGQFDFDLVEPPRSTGREASRGTLLPGS